MAIAVVATHVTPPLLTAGFTNKEPPFDTNVPPGGALTLRYFLSLSCSLDTA